MAGLEGIRLPPSNLLATAAWPYIECSVDDKAASATFERVQGLVSAIRTVRAERQVPPKKKIDLAASREVVELIKSAEGVVKSLAGIESVTATDGGERIPPASDAIPLAFEGGEVFLSGLVDAVDASAERARLTRVIEEKNRAIAGFKGKLSNEGYVNKAPAERVEETRQLLAQAEADAAAAARALQSLDA
jgi:valyl-tRNA synthetase